ncbi:sulfite exporter TauE/SafE family protein [Rugamonas sp. CCM 8940]|uniref:sulfite exporter TauE/SafE family protein n=1 Tax=Rugamonas sp. CCM 8940 TaxID=2765359 RepID=UPI0018F6E42D|nr:sulfite exporter TauE/SafE family protein [Rugamonas sp. CCM 8940]MBJ7309605.1 sulfite exporter TauE/SafE family protein [Rugamonas sp. CCM 8940]
MSGLQLLPIFLVGLAGSVHCVGMCGGIVGALSAASRPRPRPQSRPGPQPVIAIALAAPSPASPAGAPAVAPADRLARVLAYNGGRIGSYMLSGALAGGLAGGAQSLARLAGLQIGFYWLANLMLVALGLYLMDAWRGLARLEAAGQPVWRRVQPLLAPLLPMDSAAKALALGGLWGWLPCGMVYSVLLTAMLSGSAAAGAAVMLAFGLGTLPMLLGLGLLGARLRETLRRRAVRIAGGLLVLSFGLLGLARAANGLSLGWIDALCLTGHP